MHFAHTKYPWTLAMVLFIEQWRRMPLDFGAWFELWSLLSGQIHCIEPHCSVWFCIYLYYLFFFCSSSISFVVNWNDTHTHTRSRNNIHTVWTFWPISNGPTNALWRTKSSTSWRDLRAHTQRKHSWKITLRPSTLGQWWYVVVSGDGDDVPT